MVIRRFGWIFILLGLTGCATMGIGGRESQGGSYFEDPPSHILFSDKEIFNQALSLQYKGQLKPAIELWKKYLSEHTNSFKAYNNLGMAFYSNDEIGKAISAFQSALDLQADNKRIQKNLRRTLLFRVTLAKENREFAPAIRDLEKISSLSSDKDKERILREIEDIQEKIFVEVERVNTVAEYQNFLTQYPSGIFAHKAKESLKALSPHLVPEDIEKPKEFLPSLIPESAKVFKEAVDTEKVKDKPMRELSRSFKTLEDDKEQQPNDYITELQKADHARRNRRSFLNQVEPSDPSIPVEPTTHPGLKESSNMNATEEMLTSAPETSSEESRAINSPVAASGIEMVKDKFSLAPVQEKNESSVTKTRKVRVTTKSASLNIRSQPSNAGRIIGKLKKGDEVRMLDEAADWYRVVYSIGKDGWISKSFSREIK